MSERKKIIVVEDDRDFAESIVMILESAGYDVRAAEDCDRCIALIELEKPDLIILDVMMRTLTEGFTVIYELKSHPAHRTIPVLIVSAIDSHTGFELDKDFLQAEEYLKKPLLPHVLLESVGRLTAPRERPVPAGNDGGSP